VNQSIPPSSYLDGERSESETGRCPAFSQRPISTAADRETVQQILALTEELKQRAPTLAKLDEDKIRRRAREIWEENGRPVGKDEEFRFQAERELREAEDAAKEARNDI
jgi:hypothetical protein